MKTIAIVAAAAATLAAASAHADTFNGPSVGVQGGWEENSVNNTNTAVGRAPITAKGDAGTVGVFAGYDWHLAPHAVVGAQAEYNFPLSSHINDGTNTIDSKRSIDLSVRAGYLYGGNTLFYGRVGYTNVRASVDMPGLVYASGSQNGLLLGAGIERAVTKNVTGRIEYRYTDLAEGDGKWDRHQVLAGIAYHF
jgi:outer membrane immunogenic protein